MKLHSKALTRIVKPPVCQYCNVAAELVQDKYTYWECKPCDARVGVHRDTKDFRPLGQLANAQLRTWRKNAHACFDPLWRAKMTKGRISKQKARGRAYVWLAKQLGIDGKDCHIGEFDVEQCRQVVRLCRPYRQAAVKLLAEAGEPLV